MGVSFHSAGCVKIAKVCCIKSCAININGSPRYQDQEKPAGCNRRSLITFGRVPPKDRLTGNQHDRPLVVLQFWENDNAPRATRQTPNAKRQNAKTVSTWKFANRSAW